jgi:putative ABC transport system permease protein
VIELVKEYIKIALKNICENKIRTIFAIIGISVGISSVIAIVSLGECSKTAIISEMNKMGISGINIKQKYEQMNSSELINLEDVFGIKENVSEIEYAVPVYNSYAVVHEKNIGKQSYIRGVNEEFINFFQSKILYGRFINYNDVKVKRNVVVIDQNLAKLLFKRENVVGRNIKFYNEHKTVFARIIGVLEASNDIVTSYITDKIPAIIYMPVSTVQMIENVDNIEYISVMIKQGNDEEVISNKITKLLERFHHTEDKYYVENIEDKKEQLNNILSIFTISLTAIAGISLIVGGMGIMNIMFITVNERISEIGLRKALGAKRQNILLQFLFEAIFLTGLGGGIGIILGQLITLIISKFISLQFIISWAVNAYVFIFSLVIGLIFGIYPAMKASKMLPIDALRSE